MREGAAEVVVVEEVEDLGQSPLVSITFQKDVNRKKKYLEAEPKALGITQIGLSLHVVLCVSVFHSQNLLDTPYAIPFYVFSLTVLIAGSVALAAQKLHHSTLTACLLMQSLAALASFGNIVLSVITLTHSADRCWMFSHDSNDYSICSNLLKAESHFYAGSLLIQAALLAISITLAVYCCKVVNCCGPAPKTPVITVQTRPRHDDPKADQRSMQE